MQPKFKRVIFDQGRSNADVWTPKSAVPSEAIDEETRSLEEFRAALSPFWAWRISAHR